MLNPRVRRICSIRLRTGGCVLLGPLDCHHSNTFGLSLCEINKCCSLLPLGSNDEVDVVTLLKGAAVLAETGAGQLQGLLLLGLDAGTHVLHHLALVGGEAADLHHDLADGGDSGVESSLAVGGVLLVVVVFHGGLGNDEAVVKANK